MYSQQVNGGIFFFLSPKQKPMGKTKKKRKCKSNKDTDSNFSSKIQDIMDIACDIEEDIEDSDDYKIAINTNGDNVSIPDQINSFKDEPEEALNCEIVLGAIPKIRPCSIGNRGRTYSDFINGNNNNNPSPSSISIPQIHRDVNVNIEHKRKQRNKIRARNNKYKNKEDIVIVNGDNNGHKKNMKTKRNMNRNRKMSISSIIMEQAKSPKTCDKIESEYIMEDESNDVHRDDMLFPEDGWWVCSEYYDNVDDFEYDPSFISHGVEI